MLEVIMLWWHCFLSKPRCIDMKLLPGLYERKAGRGLLKAKLRGVQIEQNNRSVLSDLKEQLLFG